MRCPHCGGDVRPATRWQTIGQAMANHEESCPAIVRVAR